MLRNYAIDVRRRRSQGGKIPSNDLMATIGRRLVRISSALLLGAIATSIDGPKLLFTPGPTAPVVVATRDLFQGTAIDRRSVAVVSWPIGKIPAGAFTSIDSLAGRVTRVPISKGEALVLARLLPAARPALRVEIAPGKRALGIRVDHVSKDVIRPNARVHVVALVNDPERQRAMGKLVVPNVRVLAIDSVTERLADGRSTRIMVAAIQVTPSEAELVSTAAARGPLDLVLGVPGDSASFKTFITVTTHR